MTETRRTSSRMVSSKASDTSALQNEDSTSTKVAGQKRKAGNTTSPQSKKGKTSTKLEQQTLEDTLPKQVEESNTQDDDLDDEDMKAAVDEAEAQEDQAAAKKEQRGDDQKPASKDSTPTNTNGRANGKDDANKAKDAQDEPNGRVRDEEDPHPANGPDGAVEISEKRENAMPSNILEKGVIYFFTRGRVDIDSPDSVQDIARSYMVLRPLPDGAKLTSGPIEDMENARLLALPKKVLPKSGHDKFLTFVEKAGVTVKQLKEDFMQGSNYETQTSGPRHTPPVTPIGEGVYAITTQGRDSHLAYMLTLPDHIGEVQSDMGIADKGSFVLSTKNPQASSPANASLPQGPEWPKEVQEEFRGLRWMPLQPKHLDYPNCSFLMIGEHPGELGKAVEPTAKDEKNNDTETPAEELEKLEGEDESRAEALGQDHLVFEDLKISHKDYPKLQTTW